jgi:drug/metabolite transporter (DMT)-like permease
MTNHAPPRSAYGAWIAVCILWGTTYLAIAVAIDTIPPLLMTASRWVLGGALLTMFLWWRGEKIPRLSAWPALTVLGVLFMGFGNGGVVLAEQNIPSGLASVLVAAIPFWVVAVERFMPNPQPLTPLRIGGLIVGFSGIVLLLWPDLRFSEGSAFTTGVLWTQIACFGWAIGTSYSKRRHADENVMAAAGLQMLLGGLVILAVALLRGEWNSGFMSPSTASLSAVAYLVVAGSLIGFPAYVYAVKHLPVSTVSTYAYVNPVIAVLLGWLLRDEPFTPRIVIAGAIVLAGMAMVRRS